MRLTDRSRIAMRREIPGLFAGLLLAVGAGGALAQTLEGEWCGTALQSGPGDHRSEWTANMVLDGATGRMDYPSLGCGGALSFERREGEVHYYRERIDIGQALCLDGGLIGVELRGGTAYWIWSGSGATANGELTPTCRAQSGVRSEPQAKRTD
jgi:hypothetical protein